MHITEITFQIGLASKLTGAPLATWARSDRDDLLTSAAFASSGGGGPGHYRLLTFKGLMQAAIANRLIHSGIESRNAKQALTLASEFAYSMSSGERRDEPRRIAGLPFLMEPLQTTYFAVHGERAIALPEKNLSRAWTLLGSAGIVGVGATAPGFLVIDAFDVFSRICAGLDRHPIKELHAAYHGEPNAWSSVRV